VQRGLQLFTRDERVTGNAIILGCRNHPLLRKAVYQIETDFGNQAELTKEEILRQFYVVRQGEQIISDPDSWLKDKEFNLFMNKDRLP